MNCDQFLHALYQWIASDALPSDLQGHLHQCLRCQKEAALLQRFENALGRHEEVEISAGFTDRVLAKLKASRNVELIKFPVFEYVGPVLVAASALFTVFWVLGGEDSGMSLSASLNVASFIPELSPGLPGLYSHLLNPYISCAILLAGWGFYEVIRPLLRRKPS